MLPAVRNIDALVARARRRAKTMAMDARPRLRTVILTCMDARIDPALLFGLKPGEVHILRNAGARVTPDVLRSLAVSQAMLGTKEVLVLAHTECGLLGHTEEQVAATVERASGHLPDMAMGSFMDLDAAVHESVEAIRASNFLAHRDLVRGYILDVKNGTVRAQGEPDPQRATRPSPSSPLGLGALRADVLNIERSKTEG
jgi:carbonic anhydrase